MEDKTNTAEYAAQSSLVAGTIDTRIIDSGGIRFRVDLTADGTWPGDQDEAYSGAALKAFREGGWQFVTVTVTPLITGIDGQHLSDSMPAVEYGATWNIDTDYLIRVFPVPKLVTNVKKNLADVRERLAGLELPATRTPRHAVPQQRT